MQNETSAQVRCQLCGGEMAEGYIQSPLFRVYTAGKLFPRGSAMRAKVCLTCGYIMQFATNPERLRPQ